MITKNEIKLIRSLRNKKSRDEEGLFIVEGKKALTEILDSGMEVDRIYSTISVDARTEAQFADISVAELKQISTLVTPYELVALVKIPPPFEQPLKGLILALDNIQDPGNLGAILRSADWFGIESIICSEDTVDVFNPKVVRASMGAVGRIKVFYVDIVSRLQELKTTHKVYGASMKGTSAYELSWEEDAVLLIGNEANGLGEKYDAVVDEYITIPAAGKVESLNAAVACSILCSEYRRQF